jgi:hypothetical protein
MTTRKRRKPKYKQLAFDTAVRNPERNKGILLSIKDYEEQVLNDECLLNIMSNNLKSKVFTSRNIDTDNILSDEDFKNKIINSYKTRNADGGFPKGYQSRFWSYMRNLSELGFVYARYNKPLRISIMAKKLMNDEIDDQEAFSVQSMKYNRKSPYRNVSNDFNYFKFIVKVLIELKKDNKKLSFENLVLSMYSKNGNVEEFLKQIYGLKFASLEALHDYIKDTYQDNNKYKTIIVDYPDVVIRMLRITGFITIISQGKLYLTINEDKMNYINDLLSIDFNFTEEEKLNDEKYFEKADSVNTPFLKIISSYRKIDKIEATVYSNKLNNIVQMFTLDESKIVSLIEHIDKDKIPIPEFKYIPNPLKLEFYIAILLYLKYGKEFNIKPNYKIDSLGMPISHAPANIGDIEIYNKNLYWLIEVTLITNKTQQLNNETTAVIRHLNSAEEFKNHSEKYLSFVAPYVHEDTKNYYKTSLILSHSEGNVIYLKPYNIKDFLETTKNKKNFADMKDYTSSVVNKIFKNS